jgi:hypothetical protein
VAAVALITQLVLVAVAQVEQALRRQAHQEQLIAAVAAAVLTVGRFQELAVLV